MNSFVSFALNAVARIYPPSAPFVAIAMQVEPYIEQAMPVIEDAIKEGPAAFHAAQTAAPELFAGLARLAMNFKVMNKQPATVTNEELAALTAHVVGIDPPGWASDETQRWWDRAQGAS